MRPHSRQTRAPCLLAITLIAGFSVPNAPAAAQETAPAATAPEPGLAYSNKWRLEVSEGANNDGNIHFQVTPRDGIPIDIHVSLKDGRGEDGCARDIRDAFKAALDKKNFKVEIDDGEDVLVKGHKGPDFAVELIESTVKGTRVNLGRE